MNRPWISCIIAAIAAVADNVVATNEPDGHAPPPPLLYAYIVFFLQLLLPQFDLDQRRFWGVVMLFKSTYYYYFSKALTPPCGYTTLTLHTRQIWLNMTKTLILHQWSQCAVQTHTVYIYTPPVLFSQMMCLWMLQIKQSTHGGRKVIFFSFQTIFCCPCTLYVVKADLHGVEGGNRDKRRLRLQGHFFCSSMRP